jgi:capsular exopolysaccharide synthesis family protein
VNDAPRYVTVRDYVRVAREHRLLLLFLTVALAAAGYYYSARQNTVYKTEATIEFQSQNQLTSVLGSQVDVGGQTPEQRAAAAAATFIRPEVLERMKRILHYDGPAANLGGSVEARAEARTNLVIVIGGGRSAEVAQDLANAAAEAGVAQAREDTRDQFAESAKAQRGVFRALKDAPGGIYLRTLTLNSVARLEELARTAEPAIIRREATRPAEPTSPHVVRTTLLGALIGLTLGLVGAFFRDSMDGRLRSTSDLSDELGLGPILGHVPGRVLGRGVVPRRGRFGRRTKTVSPTDLEGVRILRRNVEFLTAPETPKVIVVTSAVPDEGKSTVSTALATAFALAGKRTLLVEGDMRRPTLAERLGVSKAPGLSDYLTGAANPEEVLQTIALPPTPPGSRPADAPEPVPIVAITGGGRAAQPAELLRSGRFRGFLDEVKEAYDVIVVDTPPLLSVVDTLELLPLSDAVLLCVRGSRTKRAQVESARETLAKAPHGPVGVVVTGLRVGEEEPHYGYHGYATKLA